MVINLKKPLRHNVKVSQEPNVLSNTMYRVLITNKLPGNDPLVIAMSEDLAVNLYLELDKLLKGRIKDV